MGFSSWLGLLKGISRLSRPAQRSRRQGGKKEVRRPSFRVEQLEDRMLLDAVHWIGGSGNWADPTHWDAGRVPGPADDAIISVANVTVTHDSGSYTVNSLTINDNLQDVFLLSGGTLSLASNSVIGNTDSLKFSAGTLTGPGDLTVNGLLHWSGGTMAGAGATVAQGGLLIRNDTESERSLLLDQRSLSNAGSAIVTVAPTGFYGSAGLAVRNGAQITNLPGATWDFQFDSDIVASEGGPVSIFTNQGTLLKSKGSERFASGIDLPLNNSGTVIAQSGTLMLNGGGTDSGSFRADAGGTLAFGGGTHNLLATSNISGAGTVLFGSATVTEGGSYTVTGNTTIAGGGTVGGTVNFSSGQPVTIPTVSLSSGTLTGSDTVIVSGLLHWSGGTMSGTGVTLAQGGLLIRNDTESERSLLLDQRSLSNAGSAIVTVAPTGFYSAGLAVRNGAQITNLPGATWDFQFDASIGGQEGCIFNNQGTLLKSVGTEPFDSALDLLLNNSGTVIAQSGTLTLNGGGTESGNFRADAGGTLAFGMGTYNLLATSSISGTGTVLFNYVTVNESGSYNVAGNTTIAGTVNFSSGQLVTTSILTLTGGSLTGSDNINVTGTLTWKGGSMDGTGVTTVAPGAFLNINGGGIYQGLRTINNEGTNISTNPGDVFVSTDNTFTYLNSFLTSGLQSLGSTLGFAYGNPIPLLGHALSTVPDTLVNELTPGLANALQGVSLAVIQMELFQVFGAPGLNILNGSTPQDIKITNSLGTITFTLPLRVTFSGQAPFDIGLPGLPIRLNASGSVHDSVSIGLDLTFAVTQVAGQGPSAAIGPSTLRAQLLAGMPGLKASATVGLFQAEAADDPNNPSSVNLIYSSYFSTTPTGNLMISTATSGSANVNLLLSGSFGDDVINDPTVTANFQLAWTFSNANPASPGAFGNFPEIAFNNIQLHFGSFVGHLLAPAVSHVQRLTRPLAPLADFLGTPLPVLSEFSEDLHWGPIYLADLLGLQGDAVTRFVLAVHVINSLDPSSLSDGIVNLGSFMVTDPRATDSAGNAAPAGVRSDNAFRDVFAQISALSPGAATFVDQMSKLGSSDGLHFTILDDPTNVFVLLIGRPTTLFTYTLPPVDVSHTVQYDIPTPIPGVVVHFEGTVSLSVSGSFGCDSSGLQSGNVLEGFYLQSASVTLGIGILAGPGVGVPNLVTVDIVGGLDANATYTLTGGDGNSRLTASELANGQYTIAKSGTVTGKLGVEVSTLDVGDYEYTIAEFTRPIF